MNGDQTQPMPSPGANDATMPATPAPVANDATAETHIAGSGSSPQDATAATRVASANANDATAPTVVGQAGSSPTAATVISTTARVNSLDALVGRMLGGCRVDKLLGKGGMGAVFRAHQESLGRDVALKVMLPGHDADPQFAARFQREARVVAAVNHPHVVQVYDTGRADDGMLYLVMEFVAGRSLAQVIRDQGALPIATALTIIRQSAEGLSAAHGKGLVHRDIKPDNLMIDVDGRVKVMDFGLARPAESKGDSALTMSGMILGTPNYISPEAARGEPADIRADLYSLGVTLWQCIAGKLPFTGPTPVQVLVQHIEAAPPALSTAVPTCPAAVVALCDRLLAKDPAKRPATPAALVEDIANIEAALMGRSGRLRWEEQTLVCDVQASSTAALPGAATVKTGRGRLLTAVVAILVVGGGFLLWWQGRDGSSETGDESTMVATVATVDPASSSQSPAASSQPSASDGDQPETHSQPAASSQQPATGTQQPSSSSQQPATGTQQVATGSQQPAATTPTTAMTTSLTPSVPTSTAPAATTPAPTPSTTAQVQQPASPVTTPASTATPATTPTSVEVEQPAKPDQPAPPPTSTQTATTTAPTPAPTVPETTTVAAPAPAPHPEAAAAAAALKLVPLAVIPPPQPPRPATVFVSSIPSGLTVEIDGVAKGKTPANITDLTPGEHRVRIHGQGLDDQQIVVLKGGTVTRLRNPLPEPARLRILGVPAGATVTVDGRPYLSDMPVITGLVTVQIVTAGGSEAYQVETSSGRNIFGYQ